jgi:hypothetical protein
MTDTITEGATRQQQVAQAYLDAWNAHDGAAVHATFDPTGYLPRPRAAGAIGGEHLAGHVAGLVAPFPDLHFMVEDVAVDGDRVIVRCWECTHHAPRPTASSPPHLRASSPPHGELLPSTLASANYLAAGLRALGEFSGPRPRRGHPRPPPGPGRGPPTPASPRITLSGCCGSWTKPPIGPGVVIF